jgi:ribosomal protein L11 methyltransferase
MPRNPPSGTFWELEAELDPAAEEAWSLYCFEQGATGSEWREESPARLRIAYFFDQLELRDPQAWRQRFARRFPGAPVPARLSLTERRREAWDTAWHAHFAPVPAGHGFLICPPWERPASGERPGGRRPLIIEPGQGFGTGRHPTTQLVLELIEERLARPPIPDAILDVGAGSGILAIAAWMLGVSQALALDVDARALPEAHNNFALNGFRGGTPPSHPPNAGDGPSPAGGGQACSTEAEANIAVPPGRLHCVQGGPACLRGRWPLVVANLVTPVLLECAADLARLTAPGGTLIVSGVLDVEQELIMRAYSSHGLEFAEARTRDEWVACRFVKPD